MPSTSDRRAAVLILAIWLAGLGSAAQWAKFAVALEPLAGAYPGAGVGLGFVVSAVGVVGIVFGVVAGLGVARVGAARVLVAALWLGAACSALQAFLPPLPVLLASRVVEGASHTAIVVAAPTLMAQIATPGVRPGVMALWSTFFSVTFAGMAWLGGPLAAQHGLPVLLGGHAVWMAVFAALLARRLPRGVAPAAVDAGGLLRRHAGVYGSVRTALPAAGWLFYTLAFVSLLSLLGPFLDADVRRPVLTAMPLVSIVTSLGAGVVLLRRVPATQVIVAGFALGAAGLLALWAMPGQAALCLAVAGAFGLVQGASFAAVPQLNASDADRAAANGALTQMGNIGNTAGTPLFLWAVGWGGWGAFALGLAAVLAGGAVTVATLRARLQA